MAITIGDLLRIPGLGVKPIAGPAGHRNVIRWVHVSELVDPTPWLKGGELLLTTGIGVGRAPGAQRTYLRRLEQAGLAGLGFGTGFSWRRIPKALVDAADRMGFPIFEVPYEVPFIAITEAVFTRLVAEQYDLLSRSLDAEHALTRALLEDQGADGVLRALGDATGGWALLIDPHGLPKAVHPPSARRHLKAVWSALQSHRPDGLRFSLSMVERGHHVAVQPVVAQGRVEAFLAIGKRQPLTQFDRIVSSHALALLAIELSKARAVSEAERRVKGEVLERLLSGTLTGREARTTLERLGFDLARPVSVVALSGTDPAERLITACEEVLGPADVPFLAAPRDEQVLVVLQPGDEALVANLRNLVAARLVGMVRSGTGQAVPFDRLARAIREARYAVQVARTEGRPSAEFGDLGTYQLLLSLQDPEALRVFADSVLGPLDAYDNAHGGELIRSLRSFLDHNSKWERAAAELFVHRHTLRYRMRKTEELTGRDLSSAKDRMEFFLALRARDILATGEDDRSAAVGGVGGLLD